MNHLNLTYLQGIVHKKCPRCRQGDMFKHSDYHPTKFAEMHEDCPHCGLHFEIELGFFWAAMYISYGFGVLLVLLTIVGIHTLFGKVNMLIMISVAIGSIIATFPLSFRYSRVIILYLFGEVKFEPEKYNS